MSVAHSDLRLPASFPASSPDSSPASSPDCPPASPPGASEGLAERDAVTESVRDQYQRYPYPPIDPRAGTPMMSMVDYVRVVFWPERKSLAGLRVLDAGCGTGHTTVELAKNHPEVEVLGIDLSEAPLQIAKQRAERAGNPRNLRFAQRRIEDLSNEGSFDYIVSSGVLHHLAEPAIGARRLAEHLAPNGCLGLMVYAPHGRHGIYVVQELLRRLTSGRSLEEKIAVAKDVLAALPPDHPFKVRRFVDLDWGDAGLVDLLLHVQDRSYTLPELRSFLREAGLRIERFLLPYLYRPTSYAADARIHPHLAALDEEQSADAAELMVGTMAHHIVFASHAAFRSPRLQPSDAAWLQARPLRSPMLRWNDRVSRRISRGKGVPAQLAITVGEPSYVGKGREFDIVGETALVLEQCDGTRTGQQILDDQKVFAELVGASPAEKRLHFLQMLDLLFREDVIFAL